MEPQKHLEERNQASPNRLAKAIATWNREHPPSLFNDHPSSQLKLVVPGMPITESLARTLLRFSTCFFVAWLTAMTGLGGVAAVGPLPPPVHADAPSLPAPAPTPPISQAPATMGPEPAVTSMPEPPSVLGNPDSSPSIDVPSRALLFEKNLGQWDAEALYRVSTAGFEAFVASDKLVMVLTEAPTDPSPREFLLEPDGLPGANASINRTAVYMHLDGANANPLVTAHGLDAYYTNYFHGNDSAKWYNHVPHYHEVILQDIYPGIDLVYYGTPDGQLKYDFIVHPGADPDLIQLRFEGAKPILAANGSLRLETSLGSIQQGMPITHQADEQAIQNAYALAGETVSFVVAEYDAGQDLVIDPLVYSTFLGGSNDEHAYGVALDGGGRPVVAGYSFSSNYPVTVGAYDTTRAGGSDVYVTKLDSSGSSLIYSTFLGGSQNDYAFGLALDDAGSAYVTGYTFSTDYPIGLAAYDTTHAGSTEVFVTKLDASGASLVYSTFLGGSGSDQAYGFAVNDLGHAYVTGSTDSSDYPTTAGAYNATKAGGIDAFLTKLDASGSGLNYSTFLGGSNSDVGHRLALNGEGDAYVAGSTYSTDYPVTDGAYDTANAGVADVFVTKLNANGPDLNYSTFLGGTSYEFVLGIAVDNLDNAFVIGHTSSADYPVTIGAYDTSKADNYDVFVTKLDASGISLNYSTFLGGDGYERGCGVAVDVGGNAYITGYTYSSDFPLTLGAYDSSKSGISDAFLSKLDASGSILENSTFLGGNDHDFAFGIVLDGVSNPIITGYTYSVDYPVASGGYDASMSGPSDAFLTSLWLAPQPVPVEDGFSIVHYIPESAAGTTPFGGSMLKPTWSGVGMASVNLAMGEFVSAFPLLAYSNDVGADFSFDLTYRSIGNHEEGNPTLGLGWDAHWLQRLEANGSDYLHHAGDGRILRYKAAAGGYDGPAGTYSRIMPVGGDLELVERDGSRRLFDSSQGLKLTQVVDAAGNAWSLAYPNATTMTITDPINRTVAATFAAMPGNAFYDVTGMPLLKNVTDFAGRTASVEYDAASGRIKAIKTPGPSLGTQYATRFNYDSGGHLVAVRDPEGQVYLYTSYDAAGRVVRQYDKERLRFDFEYNYTQGLTRVRDGNGNRIDWNFLPAGASTPNVLPVSQVEYTRGLRVTDPPHYTTTYAFNAQDELTHIMYPAGNEASYRYDEASSSFHSRGNLLEETRTPGNVRTLRDEENFQANLTTRYEYDPTYNVVTKVIDPRGAGSYAPPNGGTATAARYTTRIYYDFEEALLGDLNGDGVTSSTDRKPVKIVYPTVNAAGSPHSAFTSAYANQASVEKFTWNAAGQLLSHEDPTGVQEARTYYASGASAGYLKDVTVDDGGLDLTTGYAYNSLGELAQVTDPEGHARNFTVDLRGRVTQETGPAPTSYRTKWTYDKNDNVEKMERETDAATNVFAVTTYEHDSLGRLVKETVDADRSSTIDAAIAGQGSASPESYSVLYDYDGNGNLVQRTGGAGDVKTWRYDERNLLLSQSGPEGGSYAYDANGNLAAHADPRGNVTRYQFDGYDRPSVRIDALGNVFVQNHDAAGNVVRERGFAGGPFGAVLYERRLHHDEAHQAYRMDEWHDVPLGSSKAPTTGTLSPGDDWVTTLTQRDARGLVVRGVNDNAHATVMEYDDAGRLTQSTDALGNEVEYAYDANGNVESVTERDAGSTGACPQVCATSYTYDSENRVHQATNPDGSTRNSTYDGRGNLVKLVDELGNQVEAFYDHADRPWVVRRKLDASTNLETTTHWDAEGRAAKRCDDQDQCTAYAYMPATPLVASETSTILPGVTHIYDANGNRVLTSYGNGRQVRMGYDALDRRTSVDVTPDLATIGTTHQGFTYDGLGRITQATDNGVGNLGSGVVTALTQTTLAQQFDTLGRVVTEAQNHLTVHHTRDGIGNVLQSTYPTIVATLDLSGTDPNARVVSRSYDDEERLDRVWDAKGLIADYSYHGHRVTKKEFGGPVATLAPTSRTFIDYDSIHRPDSVLHKDAAGTVLAGFETRYDGVGNRVAEKHLPAAANGQSQLFGFDALNRATTWKRGSINAALDNIASPVKQSTWSPDGRNEWPTWSPSAGTSCSRSTTSANDLLETCGTSPTVTYDRDANGNLHDDGTYVYHWDFLNRLVRVDDKATGKLVVGYGYDAFDRRVVKVFEGQVLPSTPVSPPQQGRLESWYTYVGPHVVQESRPVSTGGAAPPSAVHVIRQWTYGSGIDEALEMSYDANGNQRTTDASDPRHYYHHDALGSVIGLTNEAGHLVEGYLYDPYGGVQIRKPGGTNADVKWDASDAIVAKSPSENIWFFTGRQLDPETNTYHYRARQYHPGLGQFISMDPIGAWGDPMNLGNPYAYVGNNPSSFTDPYGLWSKADNRQLICEGGSSIAFSLLPGVGLGCAAGRDWEHDGAVFNEGLNADYALSPLDAIPGSNGAKAGLKGSVVLGGFLLKHADEGAQVAQIAKHADEFAGAAKLPQQTRGPVEKIFRHYATAEKAAEAQAFGRLQPGRHSGKVFVTPDHYSSGAEAMSKLALPGGRPAVYVEIPASRLPGLTSPTKVRPDFHQPGGGLECWVTCSVDVQGLPWTSVSMSPPADKKRQAPSRIGKRRFLVAHDYGMGGMWALVWARSADEIKTAFPELEVVPDWPAWATEEDKKLIEEKRTYDLDTDKDKGLLGALIRERQP